jgi:diguanylate cyclase (GGDEF)-like protein
VRMIEREAAVGRPVTVLMFDIAHFKSVNDRFGHPVGDEILKLFAQVLVQTLRVTDVVGRIGGEEFAALLPCAIEEAFVAAERVRALFASAGVQVDDAPLATSVSVGVASGAPGSDLNAMLAAADTALYRAKRFGRNRVEVATELEQPLSLDRARKAVAAQATHHTRTVVHQFEGLAEPLGQ